MGCSPLAELPFAELPLAELPLAEQSLSQRAAVRNLSQKAVLFKDRV